MNREDVIREAYNRLREGFTPEWPEWESLKESEHASYRVFGNYVIAVSQEIDRRMIAELGNTRNELSLLRVSIAEYEAKEKTYKQMADLFVEGLRERTNVYDENVRLRHALINLAEKVVNGRPLDTKGLPDKLRGLVLLAGPDGTLL